MSATRLGQLLLAGAITALGALNLAWADFSYVWQPVPKWLPGRVPLAYASGIILIAFGLGMLWPRTARIATLLFAANMLAWLVLTLIPALAAAPGIEVQWLACGETMTLLAGGWILLAAVSGGGGRGLLAGPEGVRLARRVFGAALPLIGLSHFVYLKTTVSMIPGWIPFHVFFAYLTGAAHIAAGLGIFFGVLPRLAATAEAAMISLFALVVNTTQLAKQPGSHFELMDLFVAVAVVGAAWVVAGSLEGAPWGLRAPAARPAATAGSAA